MLSRSQTTGMAAGRFHIQRPSGAPSKQSIPTVNFGVSHLKHPAQSSLQITAASGTSYSNCLRDPKPEPPSQAVPKFPTPKILSKIQ